MSINNSGTITIGDSEYYDVSAMSAMFGLCIRTIRRMAKRGALPMALRIGHKDYWESGMVADCMARKVDLIKAESERLDRLRQEGQ